MGNPARFDEDYAPPGCPPSGAGGGPALQNTLSSGPCGCEPEAVEDPELENILSTSDVVDALQSLAEDSNFTAPKTLPPGLGGRKEQAGFLIHEDGEWDFWRIPDDFGSVFQTNACLFDFGVPSGYEFPENTILVHTHPWSHGQDQTQTPGCSSQAESYESLPGNDDADALNALGIDYGIIIDKDKIIMFDSDYEEEDPVDTEFRNCY